MYNYYIAEREKQSTSVLEWQSEALAKGACADGAGERGREDARVEGSRAEAEPAAPAVGRWGAEWPS